MDLSSETRIIFLPERPMVVREMVGVVQIIFRYSIIGDTTPQLQYLQLPRLLNPITLPVITHSNNSKVIE